MSSKKDLNITINIPHSHLDLSDLANGVTAATTAVNRLGMSFAAACAALAAPGRSLLEALERARLHENLMGDLERVFGEETG